MVQVRRGLFETNSSSTHSICITEEDFDGAYPFFVTFSPGEYGWEIDTLATVGEKASYLWTAMLCLYSDDELAAAQEKIVRALARKGIECDFDMPVKKQYRYSDDWYYDGAYIDHSDDGELREFVGETIGNEGQLLRYLFSDHSYVQTGNDNEECDVEISEDYPYREYFKGN